MNMSFRPPIRLLQILEQRDRKDLKEEILVYQALALKRYGHLALCVDRLPSSLRIISSVVAACRAVISCSKLCVRDLWWNLFP